jgi:histidine ammonia-lyase
MIEIDGESLTLENMRRVADGQAVSLAKSSLPRIEKARRFIEDIVASDRVVYGINTGFGALADVRIPPGELIDLQINLVRSHACGVGAPLSTEAVRSMMLLRANVLAKGYSGCRPVVIDTLIRMLNAGVHPRIPSRGSVGASGDLAPLAHLALVVIGEGEAEYRGERMSGVKAMRLAGIPALRLEAKEGLALLNGTQALCSVGGLALIAAESLASAADIIGAMTLDALRGTPTAFDPRIQRVRPHSGQAASARRLTALIKDSEIRESHRDPVADPRVQDAYSLRCMPQVHGAVRDALAHVRHGIEIEINSATDNPLIFADDGEALSGGNFHGEPVALGLDYAGIAIADLATISERRTERLVNPQLSGLPAFLAANPGTNSGMMIAQVTAASLIAENSVLAHPATSYSLPTSANREDHVSMGMTAALKFAQIVSHTELVLAIELLCAAQAIDFLAPLKPAPALVAVYDEVRKRVPPMDRDMQLGAYIENLAPLVRELDRIVGIEDHA